MWRGERGREGGVLESSHGVGDIGMKHEESRHVDRSVLRGQCVCLWHQTMSSVGNRPPSFFPLCCISRPGGAGENPAHMGVCGPCECGGCLRGRARV